MSKSGIESLDASVRSDSKFLQSDKKDKLTKAKGGKLTEVEENDLELEGGMMDD